MHRPQGEDWDSVEMERPVAGGPAKPEAFITHKVDCDLAIMLSKGKGAAVT